VTRVNYYTQKRLKTATAAPPTAAAAAAPPAAAAAAAAAAAVAANLSIIYSTQLCMRCSILSLWFLEFDPCHRITQ
jgi:hypothetical protein